MGEVFRARDTRLGREVAIKVLPDEMSRDAQRLARFEREARSSSALNHSNIVTIYDFTSNNGQAWLVMELVRGESLRQTLARGPLPLKRVTAIAAGVADGLAAAHAAGLVHRDLKPENIMITPEGTAKILDFGLAKNLALTDGNSPTDVQVSRAGVVIGTAGYMSPEQAMGEEVDFRTDHFSLGLILHEMVTGKNPLRRTSTVETLSAIINEDVPPLGEAAPEPFAWIVDRCLAKNRTDRYGSTADLAYELRRLRDRALPVAGRKAPPVKWGAAALGGVIAAIAIAIALVYWRRAPHGMTQALQGAIPTPEIAQVFRDEVALPVALSPTGDALVVYGMDSDGIPALWLHDLQTGASRQIADNAFSVGWSTDGRSIAYFSGGKLKTVQVEGGPERVLCDARPEGTPAWSGDNILYVQYSGPEIGIFRVSATGGKPERIIGPDFNRRGLAWWPHFLPDGKHFLYLLLLWNSEKGSIDHELRVGSLDGKPSRVVPLAIDSRAEYAAGQLLYVRDGTLLAQPFDPDQVRATGEARPVVDGVHYFANTGLAAFSASQNGVLAWRIARNRSRLVWIDRAGAELKTIGTAYMSPLGRISPDGKRYATALIDPKRGLSDIWMYDLERDSSERVTLRSYDENAPVWAPDGRAIYFRSDGYGRPPDIVRLNLGAELPEMIYPGPGVEEPHDVSSDGKWLLFVDHRQGGAADIYALPLKSPGTPVPFATTQFNEQSPRFSPDARWVAYESNASGRPEVYVRRFEGSELPTRISKDGGSRPRWRGDGKEIYFLGAGGRVMSAPIGGTPRLLFQSTDLVDFEPAADGSRFLVQLEERSTDSPVHMMINWPARMAAH